MLLRKAIPVKFLSRDRSQEPKVGLLISDSQVSTGGYGLRPFDARQDNQSMTWAGKKQAGVVNDGRGIGVFACGVRHIV